MKRAYLVCLFQFVATTLMLSQSNPIFAPAVAYGSGGLEALSTAAGDFNGDGKPDLVVLNGGSTTVGVLLGNGDGTFQAVVTYGSGGVYPQSVAVADVNGDGKPDLVVAGGCGSSNCGNVGVLLGNGDGTFQAVVTYFSGALSAESVAVADVNRDGKPDLVVANYCLNSNVCAGGAVGVLLGNGDGTFQAAVNYDSGGSWATSVAVADVNGDGKPDVVVTNIGSPATVGVLLGNGDGTFHAAMTYGSGGSSPYFVAVADVNGDGKRDLVVSNCGCSNVLVGSVSVLLGNGDGTFHAAVTYGSGGVEAFSVALGDFNGDGKPDVAVANEVSNTVGVLLGNGDGTFQTAVTYGSGGVQAYSVAVGDFNGDGKPDVAVANVQSTVGVLLNISSFPITTTITSSSNPSNFGQSVMFTATVTPKGSGTPTGTVTFSDGATILGTSPLNGGTTTVSTAALTVGLHSINASYSGDANFSSSSASLNQTVNPASTTLTLGSSANPSGFGQPVIFTATITTQSGGQASGTVTFTDGNTTLGSVALNGNVANLTTSGLAIGTHSITALYSGDANHAASTSALLTQTVKAATTTTTLASSTNPSMLGSSVMFTATVTTSASTTTTGTVTFMDGATTLGTGTLSGGVATYTTSSLAVGQHSMTAVYSGDTNNAGSTSSVLTQTVNAANFTLTSNPASTTVTAGHSGTFTVTVTPQGSFTSPISFTCTGLPTLAACGFSPTMVTPNTSTVTTTLTITTAAHTAALAPPPFGHRSSPLYAIWLVLPAMLLGTAGMAAPNRRKLLSYCLVFLLVGGCLLQVACAGASNNGGGGSGGTGGTPVGTYTVTVTGAAGSTQHTTTVTLTVQ